VNDSTSTTSPSGPGLPLQPTSTPLVEDAAFDQIIFTWIANLTNMPVNLIRERWTPNPLPQPEVTTDWCAIGITGYEPENGDIAATFFPPDPPGTVGGTNPNGFMKTSEHVQMTLMSSFYGPNSRGNAQLMRSNMMVAQNREYLYQFGLSLSDAPSPYVFVPEIVNETPSTVRFVRRVDCSFRMRRHIVRTYAVDSLLSAQIMLETMNVGGTIITRNFTSPDS
jgi:hypothetical protein